MNLCEFARGRPTGHSVGDRISPTEPYPIERAIRLAPHPIPRRKAK